MSADLPLLRSKILADAGFSHGFTTRIGGVSQPPYESLDFAVLRDTKKLEENQARLGAAVGFDRSMLHQTMQVHGTRIVTVSKDDSPSATLALEADGLIAEPGSRQAVAVRVADCVPILLADRSTGRVAAIHAGWRGAEAGVIRAAIEALTASSPSSPPPSLIAAVGPCIGACCFEVGLDVAERIVKSAPRSDALDRKVDDKAYVDLRMVVRSQLRDLDVNDDLIEDVPGRGRDGCTKCDAKRFYSYRRDGDSSGRLVGVIVAR